MKRILTLPVLLASLGLVGWILVTLDGSERANAPEFGAARTAQAASEVALAEVGSVESRSEPSARTGAEVVRDVVEQARGADESGELSEAAVGASYIVAVAVDHYGRPLADRELRLVGLEVEDKNAMPLPMGVSRTGVDGAVRFEVDATAFADLAVWLSLRDTQTGAGAWSAAVVVPVGGEMDLGTVVLALPRELYPEVLASGRVTEADFAPVPGVVGSVSARHTLRDGAQVDGSTEHWEGEVAIDPTGHFAVYGQPSAEYLSLGFSSPGYNREHLAKVAPGTHGLEVFLARELRLRGRLIVPEHGPRVTSYSVWLMGGGGKGQGVAPNRDGEFRARGPSRSIELKVTGPTSGLVLFQQVFAVTPETDGDLGTIDLRPLAKPLDIQLVDGAGSALAKVAVWIEVKDSTNITGHPRGLATTTTAGRLLVSVPAHALEATLTVVGRAPVVVDLVSPPQRVELR